MRNVTWRAVCIVAAAGLTAAAQPRPTPPAVTSRISGVVVNGVTGQPLSQARVRVEPDNGSSKEIEMTTASDGRFLFDRLPAGSWTLSAERRGFLGQRYGQRFVFNTGAVSVVTGPGGVSENLTFRLSPPAAIRGKVIDENGEPVMGALLQLLMKVHGMRTYFRAYKTAATDDTGEYRIPDLPADTCYLSAVVPVPASGSGFAPQYYSNASSPLAATPVQLVAGRDFTADFTLHRGRGVELDIEGSSGVAGGSESELFVLLTEGPQHSEIPAGTLGPGSGRTFHNVLPGRYRLMVGDLASTYVTSKWIEVGSENVSVTLPFPNPPAIAAKVSVAGGDAKLLQNAMLAIYAFGAATDSRRPLGPDGSAVFPGMAAGRYHIVLQSQDLYIKSVTARNARIVDDLVDLPENGPVQLEIVAAADGARVMGKVRTGDKPVSGARVVLAPNWQSPRFDDYHEYISDSDGTFDFRGIRPGGYTVFATTDESLESGNRAAIRKYAAAGKAVKAEANGSVEVQLELVNR